MGSNSNSKRIKKLKISQQYATRNKDDFYSFSQWGKSYIFNILVLFSSFCQRKLLQRPQIYILSQVDYKEVQKVPKFVFVFLQHSPHITPLQIMLQTRD